MLHSGKQTIRRYKTTWRNLIHLSLRKEEYILPGGGIPVGLTGDLAGVCGVELLACPSTWLNLLRTSARVDLKQTISSP